MSALERQLKNSIRQNGPMNVATFMDMVLRHYYSTRDPFGVKGDFTTSPEISQMFGEMIAIFLADTWVKMKGPPKIIIVEAGPGRGTLMADILRTLRKMSEFYEAINIHLIETSPILRQKQMEALKGYNVQWHDMLQTVPQDQPMFFVANEFLDALPVRQYLCEAGSWRERVITLTHDDRLVFDVAPGQLKLSQCPKMKGEDGDIFELSEARENFVRDVSARLQKQGGVGLFIDYGFDQPAFGDTFQAVRDHKYVDILSDIGEADLTSHVDFAKLVTVVGPAARGPVTQGAFLKHLGIEERAEKLKQPEELKRLAGDDQMGRLFRVMGICHDPQIKLAAFP